MGLIILLAPLVLFYAIASDMYVPALYHMPTSLHTTPAIVQLTLSGFMLAVAFGKLVFGPLSDRLGRYATILLGASLFTLGSVLCASAPNISFLIGARLLQALGACATLVTAYAVLRDYYAQEKIGTACSYLNATLATSALIGPFIGSYLDTTLGWRSIFMLLALIGCAVILIELFYFKETLPSSARIKFNYKIFFYYFNLLKHSQFRTFAFAAGAGLAVFFLFSSVSSYFISSDLHKPEKDFGFYYLAVSIVYLFGSLCSAYSCRRWGMLNTVRLGGTVVFLAGISMYLAYHVAGLTTLSLMIPMLIAAWGGALLMGAGMAGALAPFPQMAGIASALLGFLQFAIASSCGEIIVQFSLATTMPLGIALSTIAILSLLLAI